MNNNNNNELACVTTLMKTYKLHASATNTLTSTSTLQPTAKPINPRYTSTSDQLQTQKVKRKEQQLQQQQSSRAKAHKETRDEDLSEPSLSHSCSSSCSTSSSRWWVNGKLWYKTHEDRNTVSSHHDPYLFDTVNDFFSNDPDDETSYDPRDYGWTDTRSIKISAQSSLTDSYDSDDNKPISSLRKQVPTSSSQNVVVPRQQINAEDSDTDDSTAMHTTENNENTDEKSIESQKITTGKPKTRANLPWATWSAKITTIEQVSEVPYDTNGSAAYLIKFSPTTSNSEEEKKINRKTALHMASDGWNWKDYEPSKKKFHFQHSFVCTHKCKGGHQCTNKSCQYLKMSGGIPNTKGFDNKGKCFSCGQSGVPIACSVYKTSVFDAAGANDDIHQALIFYEGTHTCQPEPQQKSQTPLSVAKLFLRDTHMNPRQAQSKTIMAALDEFLANRKTLAQVMDVADSVSDLTQLSNLKQKTLRLQMRDSSSNIAGSTVNSLAKYSNARGFRFVREYVCEDTCGTNIPHLLKVSDFQLRMLEGLSNRESVTGNSWVHTDGTHRVTVWTTIALHFYHPTLRHSVTSATFEAKGEGEEVYNLFWKSLNDLLDGKFDLVGWVADEAGANWRAIGNIFFQGTVPSDRAQGCIFHFLKCERDHLRNVPDSLACELKQLVKQWINTDDVKEAEQLADDIEDFIKTNSQLKHLDSWWSFWYKRRGHIMALLRPTGAPATNNIAEVVHSSWNAATGGKKISLEESILFDMAEALRIENIHERWLDGKSTRSASSTTSTRSKATKEDELDEERKQARLEFNKAADADLAAIGNRDTHRADTKLCKNKKGELSITTHVRKPKKGDVDSKRDAKTRIKWNEEGRQRLVRALTEPLVLQDASKVDNYMKFVVSSADKKKKDTTYDVILDKSPTCTCKDNQIMQECTTKQSTCKHILFVLSRFFGLTHTDALMVQWKFTRNEINDFLNAKKWATKFKPIDNVAELSSLTESYMVSETSQSFPVLFQTPENVAGATCAGRGCGKHIDPGSFRIDVVGKIAAGRGDKMVKRLYSFCATGLGCISTPKEGPTRQIPAFTKKSKIVVDPTCHLSKAERQFLKGRGLDLVDVKEGAL